MRLLGNHLLLILSHKVTTIQYFIDTPLVGLFSDIPNVASFRRYFQSRGEEGRAQGSGQRSTWLQSSKTEQLGLQGPIASLEGST